MPATVLAGGLNAIVELDAGCLETTQFRREELFRDMRLHLAVALAVLTLFASSNASTVPAGCDSCAVASCSLQKLVLNTTGCSSANQFTALVSLASAFCLCFLGSFCALMCGVRRKPGLPNHHPENLLRAVCRHCWCTLAHFFALAGCANQLFIGESVSKSARQALPQRLFGEEFG